MLDAHGKVADFMLALAGATMILGAVGLFVLTVRLIVVTVECMADSPKASHVAFETGPRMQEAGPGALTIVNAPETEGICLDVEKRKLYKADCSTPIVDDWAQACELLWRVTDEIDSH